MSDAAHDRCSASMPLEVVYHRAITAVQGVSLQVEAGQIVAMLGTNGAGKTTVLRAISGFLGLDDARVTEGTIRFMGESIENLAPHLVTGLGIALVPERDKVFRQPYRGRKPRGRRHAAQRRSCGPARDGLTRSFRASRSWPGAKPGYLSGGERQMLAIGSALMCAPELLLVDELSQGLAPLIVQELMHKLLALRDQFGLTILLVEQNARVALDAPTMAT